MTDSQEKSDDLIAELAKLMANDGQTSTAPKPSVIKLPPLGEPQPAAGPAPVRIPGMEPARAAAPASLGAAPRAAAPTVRIPGMERPAGVADPIPAPAPRSAASIDFGRPVAPSPMMKQEPLVNWPAADVPRSPAPPIAAARPAPAAPAAHSEPPVAAPPPRPAPQRMEPGIAMAPPPAPASASNRPVPADDSFDFDFGFGKQDGHADGRAPGGEAGPAADPIAELIGADEAHEAAEAIEKPAPAPVAATPQPPLEPVVAPAGARLMSPLPQRPIAIKPVSIPAKPADEKLAAPAPLPAFSAIDRPMPAVSPAAVAASAPAVSSPPQHGAAAAPKVDLDPMDEIENLIGEAVRVELSHSEAARPAPAPAPAPMSRATPVVPPLGGNFAPRRTSLKDTDPQVQSAEAAIMAAAAASGAELGRIEAPMADERPYKRAKVKPPKTTGVPSGLRQYVGIGVAATLLLAAGFGLYWVLGMGRSDPATAPVLTADASPAKVEPVVVPAPTTQQSGAAVFNEIAGLSQTPADEALVSRDETAGASVTEVASVTAPPAGEATETGLANRKVRTVTVRPDGTIVSGDEAVAGTSALPVERPNVPEIPGAQLQPSELLTAVAEAEATAGAPAAARPAESVSALVAAAGNATSTPAPLNVAATPPAPTTPAVFDASLVAPRPMPRPASRSALVGGGGAAPAAPSAIPPASTPLTAVAPPASAPTTTQASNRGGAYVQLSSQRSESEAAQSLRTTQSRLAGRLNGAQLEIRRVDLGAKGVWYRVVLPTGSFQDATQTCAAIKSGGGDCVAING